jgi:hypothetical protein
LDLSVRAAFFLRIAHWATLVNQAIASDVPK